MQVRVRAITMFIIPVSVLSSSPVELVIPHSVCAHICILLLYVKAMYKQRWGYDLCVFRMLNISTIQYISVLFVQRSGVVCYSYGKCCELHKWGVKCYVDIYIEILGY